MGQGAAAAAAGAAATARGSVARVDARAGDIQERLGGGRGGHNDGTFEGGGQPLDGGGGVAGVRGCAHGHQRGW